MAADSDGLSDEETDPLPTPSTTREWGKVGAGRGIASRVRVFVGLYA